MTADEKALRKLIKNWNQAIERKDSVKATEHYLPQTVLFDIKPPYKVVGAKTIREMWEDCFPYMPKKISMRKKDEKLVVAGDMACYFCLASIAGKGMSKHPAARSWLRATVVFQKIKGAWKVIHEHASYPWNPANNKAAFINNPKDLMCGIDYSQTPCE